MRTLERPASPRLWSMWLERSDLCARQRTAVHKTLIAPAHLDLMHFPLEPADEIQAVPAKGASRSLLRVTHLSTTDLVGGAGLAATRLHEGLLRNGVASRMLVAIRRSKHDSVSTVRPFPFLPDGPGRIAFAVCRRIQHRRRCTEVACSRSAACIAGKTCCGSCTSLQPYPSSLDRRHGRLCDRLARARRRRVPLVWTFHDMNCFTGGCHYDGHCGRFAAACGLCPQLGSSKENDLSRWAFARKQKALAELPTNRLVIVCPSQWMANKVSLSPLFQRFRRVTIQYGIDTDLFGPTSREQARAKLGLPFGTRRSCAPSQTSWPTDAKASTCCSKRWKVSATLATCSLYRWDQNPAHASRSYASPPPR